MCCYLTRSKAIPREITKDLEVKVSRMRVNEHADRMEHLMQDKVVAVHMHSCACIIGFIRVRN
jgi:hypothetical protein